MTRLLLRIRRLQSAGYPLSTEDLTEAGWLWLGALNEALDAQRFFCPLLGR